MFKNILLSNIDIDASHKNYRRLIMSNLAYLIASLVLIIFFLVNYFIRDNTTAALIELFFILPALYGFIMLRRDKDIEKGALFATYLFFIAIIAVHFLFEFKEGITFWALMLPFVAMSLVGAKKGLIFSILFYIVIYFGAYYYWHDSDVEIMFYIRFVIVSFIITYLLYFYESYNSNSFEKLEVLNKSLEKRVEEIRQLSITDSLTTLYNKRHFDVVLNEEFNRAKRTGEPFVLGVIDVDNFKLYNDTYGHNRGNEALERVGKVLNSQTSRSGDYAFRIGGEEFAIILQASSFENSYSHFDGLRKKIEAENIEHINNKPYGVLSVSIGAVNVNNYKNLSIIDVYKKADKNLYYVKENGRNGVKLSIL